MSGRTRSSRLREDVQVSAAELLSIPETPGEVTDDGVATNVRVGIGYLDSGCAGWARRRSTT